MTPPENASFAVPLKRLPDVFRGQNDGKKKIYIYVPEKVDDIEFFANETHEGNI